MTSSSPTPSFPPSFPALLFPSRPSPLLPLLPPLSPRPPPSQALNGFEATTKVSASTAVLDISNGLKGGSNVDLYVRSTDTTPLSINVRFL